MTFLTTAHRRTATALAVASAGLLLSGCSFREPTAIKPYAPADGLQAELGDVLVRNMLVVSEGDGAAGLLVGALVNRGDEDTTVEVQIGGTTAEVDVPAGGSVALGRGADRPDGELSTILSEVLEVSEVDAVAGTAVDLSVTDPVFGTAELRVPVVLPEGDYAEFVPEG